ncbi:transporter substrate-binding domain-containing protein [Vibrio sp. FJH11]
MNKALLVLTGLLATQSVFAAETVKFSVAAEPYPPFATKQADGTWQGFEVDLIHKICEEASLDCQIKEIAWDGIIPALVSDKIDVIFASMTVTDERAKKVLFTHPYYNTYPAVIGLQGQEFALNKDALKGKIIGVQTSTIAAFYAKEKFGKFATIRQYDTQDAVNSDLLAGRLDYMIADDIPATEFFNSNKAGLEYYGKVPYEPILGKGIAAAVRLDETALEQKLSAAIDKIVKSDYYDKLSMQYFGTNIAP